MTPAELRKLLELAAKAAGYEFCESVLRPGIFQIRVRPRWHHLVDWTDWNPADDDGDSRRLEVKLQIDVKHYVDHVVAWFDGGFIGTGRIPYDGDPYAATRRAVLRAAAAIGEAMP